MRTAFRGLLLLLVVAACRSGDRASPPEAPVLPFLAGDPAAALAVATERKLPIFIETWAPW